MKPLATKGNSRPRCLRLAKSKTIQSIRDLKREINELADKEDARLGDKTLPKNERVKIRCRIHGYNQSLSKIILFEMLLMGRFDSIPDALDEIPITEREQNLINLTARRMLRGILGEEVK